MHDYYIFGLLALEVGAALFGYALGSRAARKKGI